MPAGGSLSWPAPFVVSVGKAPEGSRTNRRTTDSPMPMYNGYFQEKRRMSACLSVKGILPVTAPIKKYKVGMG